MALLAILANPAREARSAMKAARGSLAEDVLRLARFSPRARREMSSAIPKSVLKVDVSGQKGEFVRFRVRDPKRFANFRMIVMAPEHLRGMTPTEARSRLGQTGFRRLTLGVIACPKGMVRGHRCSVGTELQAVLVPKVRVMVVARKYLKRVASNPVSPIIAGMAAGVSGAIVSHALMKLNSKRNGPRPRGSAHPLKRIRGPIAWEDLSKVQRLQIQRQFLAGGMPYDPRFTRWTLYQYPKQVGGFRLWKQSVTVQPNRTGAERPTISIPFRQGRKYSVDQVARWVEAHGTKAMVERFKKAIAQYRRFHKGASPKFITYQTYRMGSHPGISDVEFGVSEGHEWLAAYQVPKSSGKWADKASDGRYVHAHGDSEVEVDVKRPVRLSKLPHRFHTPDGKGIGVIPSSNVKIGEWYEG